MSSIEDQLKSLEAANAELKEALDKSQQLVTNMGNELDELYEVIKGLEKERDDAVNALQKE